LIEQAYTVGERMGLAVCGMDEAGPYQAIPQPGIHWQPVGQSTASSSCDAVGQGLVFYLPALAVIWPDVVRLY
jgi:hypothetical protein